MLTQKKRQGLTKKADAAFSKAIRARGYCQLKQMHPDLECSGALQCCHIISRRYRAIRWSAWNALAGCQAHHTYFTHRPLEWEVAVRGLELGDERWEQLRSLALSQPPMDPAVVLTRYQEEP